MQKGSALIFILLGILILAGVASGAYYLGKSSTLKSSPAPVISSQTPQPTPSAISDETANWKTYTDIKNGFTLRYPLEAEVRFQKLSSMLSTTSDGVSIAPSYQAPYDKWYSFDVVVRDSNLDARSIINNYLEETKKICSPPGCATQKLIADTLKPYKNGNIDGYVFHIGAETDSAMVVEVKQHKVYIFRMTGDQGIVSNYGLKLLDQILSTFKFTD